MSEQFPQDDNRNIDDTSPRGIPRVEDSLPPLEPTAEVPPVHSDTLNDPQYWNKKFEGRTATVPVEHRDEPKKPSIAKKVIAGIAGIAVIGGGAALGIAKATGGSSNSNEGHQEPSATAPANTQTQAPETSPSVNPSESNNTTAPSSSSSPEQSQTTPTSPVEEVGVKGTTFETANTKVTPEMIQEAEQPVTVADYPTPEEALKRFGQIENVFYLSATVTNDGSTEFPETTESKQVAIDILTNMLGSEESAREFYNRKSVYDTRHSIGILLWLINESGAVGDGSTPGTWYGHWSVDGAAEKQPDRSGAYSAEVESIWETNFEDIDPSASDVIEGLAPVMKEPIKVVLHNDGKVWKIDDIEFEN